MPATVPACCGSKCRSRLIFGKARDMFVRSINAIVYMMRATGMMRIHRCEIRDGVIPMPESRSCAVFIMIKNSPRLFHRSTVAGRRRTRRQPALGAQVLPMAVFRTPVLQRLYSRDGGLRDNSGSVLEPGCLSWRESGREYSPITRNGRDLASRQHPKLDLPPNKCGCTGRHN